ncbi:MAG: YraN family protein [Spirochaetes bacterium]|nr:YraN family protein [Spirochaetota bacterium]
MNAYHNRDLGAGGEELAVEFLEGRNFRVIERNYRYGKSGEIDIIARRDTCIIFVEVKNRISDRFGGALYSISAKKKRNLKAAARSFIASRPEYDSPEYIFRFDLISIRDGGIDWIEDMFR